MKSLQKYSLAAAMALTIGTCVAAESDSALPPDAMVHSISAYGDRGARAELIVDGRVITVQVGDELRGWNVEAISRSDVVLSRIRLQADPLTAKGAKVGAARSARESSSWFAPVHKAKDGDRKIEFKQTHKLPSAIDSNSAGSTRGPMSAISIQ